MADSMADNTYTRFFFKIPQIRILSKFYFIRHPMHVLSR